MHKASENKDKERPPGDGNTLRPFFKESRLLSIRMEMRREEEDEAGEEEDMADGCIEEDAAQTEGGTEGGKKEMIVVTMTKTSISVVSGRGCGPDDPCRGCQGKSCTFQNVVIVSETSAVTVGGPLSYLIFFSFLFVNLFPNPSRLLNNLTSRSIPVHQLRIILPHPNIIIVLISFLACDPNFELELVLDHFNTKVL